jgi:hypothetical protein
MLLDEETCEAFHTPDNYFTRPPRQIVGTHTFQKCLDLQHRPGAMMLVFRFRYQSVSGLFDSRLLALPQLSGWRDRR